ncbi:MAG: DUF1080 domain-containing protein [Fibrobacteria bacterium]
MSVQKFALGLMGLLGFAASVSAQSFTKADSGWVPLFNGKDFEGIYGRLYSQPVTPVPDPTWIVAPPEAGTTDPIIRGSSTSKQGNIGTKKNYSHYRMRVEYRHDVAGNNNNAGITYHTDESKERMSNSWPFSIECQMKQSETGSAFSIAGLAFDTRVSGNTYAPTGGSAATGCLGSGCTARNFNANPIIKGGTHWQKMEIIIRGSDTAWHLVNDKVVFKLWNMRVKTSTGFGEKVTSGGIGLQSEGALINYRRWEIMELPATGPNNLVRLLLTNTNGGAKIAPGSTHNITWKTLGDVSKVNILYNTGTGTWQAAASDVANTGTYAWTVPTANTAKLRVVVSGTSATPWAMADTSDADNEIGSGLAITKRPVGSFNSKVSPEDLDPEGARDMNGRAQGKRFGKDFRILYNQP